jgi:hypothetical protein
MQGLGPTDRPIKPFYYFAYGILPTRAEDAPDQGLIEFAQPVIGGEGVFELDLYNDDQQTAHVDEQAVGLGILTMGVVYVSDPATGAIDYWTSVAAFEYPMYLLFIAHPFAPDTGVGVYGRGILVVESRVS